MRALKIVGPSKAEIQEVAEPEIGTGQVKVTVERAGICGSDLGAYMYGTPPEGYRHPILNEDGPFTLGHEFSGRVTEIGSGVGDIAIGDLVAIRPNVWDGTCAACQRGDVNLCENGGFIGLQGGGGGFSDTVVVPADNAFVLPAGTTPEVGALVESTAVAWHAAKVGGVRKGSIVAIVGAGPVGLALILTSRALGAEKIVVSELSESRKELAAQLGADVVDPRETDLAAYIRDTYGDGADVSFEASGAGAVTLKAAVAAVRNGGTIIMVASSHGEVPIDLNTIMNSQKRLVGTLAYTNEDFAEVITAIAVGTLDPSPLVSSTISLDDAIEKGLNHLLGEGRNSEVKILVRP